MNGAIALGHPLRVFGSPHLKLLAEMELRNVRYAWSACVGGMGAAAVLNAVRSTIPHSSGRAAARKNVVTD